MKRSIFTIMAIAAALCACNKNQMIGSEVIDSEVEPGTPLVFTATMEGASSSKATFDYTYKCASWEVNDLISINGNTFQAKSAGTSTTFAQLQEVRPTYVGTGCANNNMWYPPRDLVDDAGTSTVCWLNWVEKNSVGTWDIVVKTDKPARLLAINLWNGGDIESNPEYQWKDVKVLGSTTESGDWTEIKTFNNLDLAIKNNDLAGTLDVNATQEYEYYKVEVLSSINGKHMMMADMKFVIKEGDQIQAPYTAYFPSYLYDGSTATLPSEITEKWTDGKFNMPMYAYSTDTDLEFKNLCGVLKITVKSSQIATVKSISVSTDKAISGAFTVDANNAAVLTNPNNEDNTITINYSNAVTTDATGKVFYVPLPAQTYGNLVIQVSDGTQSLSMTTKSGANIVVARNKIYPITFMHDNYLYSDGDESYVEEDETIGNGWFR